MYKLLLRLNDERSDNIKSFNYKNLLRINILFISQESFNSLKIINSVLEKKNVKKIKNVKKTENAKNINIIINTRAERSRRRKIKNVNTKINIIMKTRAK